MATEDDLERELDDFLAIDVPLAEPSDDDLPGAGPPVVGAPTEDVADKLLYKTRRLSEEAADVRALATRRRAEIDAWEADRLFGIDRETSRIRESLELFMRSWHRSHPRSKTLSLPNGKLTLRGSGRGKIIVTEEWKLVEWAEQNGRKDLLRYKPAPAKSVLADEALVTRHLAVQDEVGTGELLQTWRLMVDVVGPEGTESVSIPGVVYAEPIEDRFGVKLPEDGTDQEDDSL